MKKHILYSILVLLITYTVNGQISYSPTYNTTEEQFAEANMEFISKPTTIIDGIVLDTKLKSLVKDRELDGVRLIKLTHVLRSNELKNGDTIIVIFRNGASGTETMHEANPSGYPSGSLSINSKDQSLYCEWFLKEYPGEIDVKSLNWGNRKVYEFYQSKFGYAAVYFKDSGFTEAPFDVYALFDLKFKTRQDWYNYLKKYDNIKVPEGY